MPILIVQHISTYWSKASRGGPLARVRNAVPLALPISKRPPSGAVSVFHEAQFKERCEFKPVEDFIVDSPAVPRGRALCIRAGLGADGAWASYDYDNQCGGAPARPGVTKKLIAPLVRFVSIISNGRFSSPSYGDWFYEKHVVNVGQFASFDPDCFTETEPVEYTRDGKTYPVSEVIAITRK